MTFLAAGAVPVLITALLAVAAGEVRAQSGWSIRKLIAPGLAHGVAWDLDEAGNIVGEMYDAQGAQHAVVWLDGTGYALPGIPGGKGSARALDASGRIGGYATGASLPATAVCWRPSGGGWDRLELDAPPFAMMATVLAFGANRLAAGYADDGLLTVPVAWLDAEVPASLRELPLTPGGFAGSADAVDGAFVYGHVVDGSGMHPARWTRRGRSFALSLLPSLSAWGEVTDTSSDGRVVGASISPATGRIHIVEWRGSVLTDHGTLPGKDCYAEGINARGDVVGWARTFAMPPYVAIARLAGTPIRALQELAPAGTRWTLTRAHAIGDDGTIVGIGELDGFVEPFVMTPLTVAMDAPSPGSAGVANEFAVHGLAPFADVAWFVGLRGGETAWTGCATGLDLDAPLLVGIAAADAEGNAALTVPVPTWLAGLPLYWQAFQPAKCAPSNVVAVTFR